MMEQLYKSGKVRRWHTHPNYQQNIADHSWGVAMMIISEHPNPSLNLIKWALLHDCHEYVTGDIPPEGKKVLGCSKDEKDFQGRWLEQFNLNLEPLTEEEQWWLDYADKAEAMAFVSTQIGPDYMALKMFGNLMETMKDILKRGQP